MKLSKLRAVTGNDVFHVREKWEVPMIMPKI